MSSPHNSANHQTTVQLEYEPTVSSSTGDHFGPNDGQNCGTNTDMMTTTAGPGGGTDLQNEIIVPQNNYSYQSSAQHPFHSYQRSDLLLNIL